MTKLLYIPTGTILKFPPEMESRGRTGSGYFCVTNETAIYEETHYHIKYSYSFDEFFNILCSGGFMGLLEYNKIPVDVPLREEFEIIYD